MDAFVLLGKETVFVSDNLNVFEWTSWLVYEDFK